METPPLNSGSIDPSFSSLKILNFAPPVGCESAPAASTLPLESRASALILLNFPSAVAPSKKLRSGDPSAFSLRSNLCSPVVLTRKSPARTILPSACSTIALTELSAVSAELNDGSTTTGLSSSAMASVASARDASTAPPSGSLKVSRTSLVPSTAKLSRIGTVNELVS